MRYILVSVSCGVAVLSVVAVFFYIPGVSEYAFWVLLASYIMLGANYIGVRPKPSSGDALAILSAVGALVSVAAAFVYISFISDYAFWFLVLAVVVLGACYLLVMPQLNASVTAADREFRDPRP